MTTDAPPKGPSADDIRRALETAESNGHREVRRHELPPVVVPDAIPSEFTLLYECRRCGGKMYVRRVPKDGRYFTDDLFRADCRSPRTKRRGK